MSANGRPRIDYTNKDYSSLREALLQVAREKLPAWTDHSANDLGVVLLELFAYMGDSLFYYEDRIANESYLETAIERRSVLNLLRLIGYELRPPRPASADLTLLFKDDAAGTVALNTGTAFQTTAQATGEPINFQYVRDPLTIDLNTLPLTTHEGKSYKLFETLPVVQVDAAVSGEILGSSDGNAGQRFALARSPLFEGSLVIDVDEGTGPKAWEQKPTLLHSLADDEHYVVFRDELDVAWAEFGDAKYAKIPRRGRNNLIASYLVGGGAKGNVPPNTISKAVTAIPDLKRVFNAQVASGGSDAEASAEAVKRGPQLFRAMGRAVTAKDYEAHAMEFGVGKARARAGGWNRIELFIAPAGGGQPTDTLKEDLRAYFEDKRIMTSILDIRDPEYVAIYIRGELEVESYYFTDQVQQSVENAVSDLLAFEHVKFEDKLYLSKVYEAVEAIQGVAGVNVTHFTFTPPPDPLPDPPTLDLPADGTLRLDWNQIPIAAYAAGIKLKVTGGRSDS
jgi:hypothetical protein